MGCLQGQLLDLEQGSEKWDYERGLRIGASEVAAIFQKSPYYTERELYLFKEGMVPEWFVQDEYIFEKGHKFEEAMRAEWFALTGQEFKPTVRVNRKYPHLIASLDGEFEDTIFEAKLVGAEVLEEIIERNKPPEHHWIQIQLQLLITKARKCIYFAHSLDGEGCVIDVYPDPSFQKEIIKKTIAFQRKRKLKEEPDMTKDDYFFAPDEPAFDLLRELNEKKTAAKKAYELAENDYKALLKETITKFDHNNVANLAARVKMKRMSRATVKWMSIPEVAALGEEYINRFRVAGKEYFQAWFSKKD